MTLHNELRSELMGYLVGFKEWSDVKNEISRITKPGGKVISFGWKGLK